MYSKSIDKILKELDTTKTGLTLDEANKRIEKYGLNKLTERKGRSKTKIFLDQFTDLMIIILIFVDIFMFSYSSIFTKDYIDALVILAVILINALMGFLEENKAEVTLKNLTKYTDESVQVMRRKKNNPEDIDIVDSKTIVPGDVIVLSAGDIVPADARIIKCSNLTVDESTLTGESLPVIKNNKTLKENLEIQKQENMLFSGSSIVSGSAHAVVCATGMNTEIGKIAKSLNTPYRVSTPLENKITELSKKITILIFIVLIFTFIYSTIKGIKLLDTVMLCVSLAVAAIPEGLPAVITICLSNGTNAMMKRKTIVRQMSSIETLGSLNIICSDKTGTITQNKMTIVEANSYNKDMLLKICGLCNDGLIEKDTFIGDPTETCLFDYIKKQGLSPEEMRKKYTRVNAISFDSDRKIMTTLNKINDKYCLLMKGSNNNVIERCKYIYKNGKKVLLTEKYKQKLYKEINEMQNRALRVMSFAYKELTSSKVNLLKEEKGLILAGIVGIIDPPREDVVDAIKMCKKAHIRPIMITGDSIRTATAIALKVGIIEKEEEAIEGKKLDDYSDEELLDIVNKYNVYARVSPKHKERIIHSFQKNGKVVAMTGDGVNDAPAIKDADVGIGMGITGTDVTKNVADIILLDDSFSTIVSAVEEGRRIFSNIRKNVVYSLSSNVAELIIVLMGLIFNKLFLLPIHILFIDLVTDSIPSIALSFETKENGIMNEKPKDKDSSLFTPFIITSILVSSIIEVVFVLISYIVVKDSPASIVSTVILLSLVMQEIIYAVSVRNLKLPIIKHGLLTNKAMNIGFILLIMIEIIFFFTPLSSLISVSILPLNIAFKIIFINILAFIVYELSKGILVKRFKD